MADASVIVRTKDVEGTIERCLRLLRAQTVALEVIVVDSGSTDGTRDIASAWCDRLVQVPPDQFTYGRALNIGAEVASAPVHVAVSAHTFLERRDWVERAISHYRRPDVAAVNGSIFLPDGRPQASVFYQDAAASRRNRSWGFSNTAASWRAAVWKRFRFDESMEASEDKEWSWRVLDAGWVIAFDPYLWIPDSHRRQAGLLALFARTKKEAAAMAERGALPPFSARAALAEWWRVDRSLPARRRFRRRANHFRIAEIAGRYAGQRAAGNR
jgi:rhamnosyltransferase